MLGPLFGSPQRSASLGCAYDWRPTVTATGDWANLSSRKMNNANKPQVYWELWPKHGPVHFLDAKGKTHGLPDSSGAGANKNRTMPLLSIMCDLLDLILISSSPQTRCQQHSAWAFIPLLYPSKPWMGNTVFRSRNALPSNWNLGVVQINGMSWKNKVKANHYRLCSSFNVKYFLKHCH